MTRIERRLSGAKTLQSREPNCVGRGASAPRFAMSGGSLGGEGTHTRGSGDGEEDAKPRPGAFPDQGRLLHVDGIHDRGRVVGLCSSEGRSVTGSQRPVAAPVEASDASEPAQPLENPSRLGAPALALDERRARRPRTIFRGPSP